MEIHSYLQFVFNPTNAFGEIKPQSHHISRKGDSMLVVLLQASSSSFCLPPTASSFAHLGSSCLTSLVKKHSQHTLLSVISRKAIDLSTIKTSQKVLWNPRDADIDTPRLSLLIFRRVLARIPRPSLMPHLMQNCPGLSYLSFRNRVLNLVLGSILKHAAQLKAISRYEY